MTEERTGAFIRSMDKGNTSFLNEIEREAREAGVPIIRPETQRLLRFLLQMQRPKRILEIGCAVGFSALLMSEYAPAGCHITTIENYGKRIVEARENFRRAGREDRITLLEGDAAEILPGLVQLYDMTSKDGISAPSEASVHRKAYHEAQLYDIASKDGISAPSEASVHREAYHEAQLYDMIFMDAAKGQYLAFLPYVKRLLAPDGLLVSDNVLQEGDVLESRYAVTRRDRTIHGRMREYLYRIMNDEAFETVILPVGDGVAASKMRG